MNTETKSVLPGSNITKVTTGALAGSLTTVLIWIVNTYIIPAGAPPITVEVAGAITVAVTAVVQRLVPAK